MKRLTVSMLLVIALFICVPALVFAGGKNRKQHPVLP